MRFPSQSAAVVFPVVVLSFVACAPLITMAQEDPFGPPATAEASPFGQATETPVKKTKATQNAQPARRMPRISPAKRPTFSSKTVQCMRIRSMLKEKSDLVFDAEPFGDVRASLAELHKVNIVIDINLEGVLDNDTEISANLEGVVLEDGLRSMLRAVDATFTIRDGNLLIISIDDEGEPDYLTRHMIDVRGLLDLIKVTEADRIGKPVTLKANQKGSFGKVEAGGGVFQVAPQAQAVTKPSQKVPATYKESEQSKHVELLTAEKILTDAITQIVAAESWAPNGTGNMDLTCVGGVLIVQVSELVAGDVRSFVHDLEFQLKSRGK